MAGKDPSVEVGPKEVPEEHSTELVRRFDKICVGSLV